MSEPFYAAIDLGSTKICTLIARVGQEGELKIVGKGITTSQGIQKGRVENIFEAKDAIRNAQKKAQEYLGKKISWAHVGMSGNSVTSLNNMGPVDTYLGRTQLSGETHPFVPTIPEIQNNQEVLHVIPRSYGANGITGMRDPETLGSNQLDMKSQFVLADKTCMENTRKSVKKSGISVKSLVLGALASGESCLSQDERELGVVLLDIGGGVTDISLYSEGSLDYTTAIPVGGTQITRDLSIALGIPFYFAEEAKLRWGHAMPEEAGDEEVLIPTFYGREPHRLSRHDLSLPLHSRLSETIKLAIYKLREGGMSAIPKGGIVLTGGTAVLPGLPELVSKLTGSAVRIGYPQRIPSLPTDLQNPAFSTSVGILLWGIRNHNESTLIKNMSRNARRKPLMRRMKEAVLSRTASWI